MPELPEVETIVRGLRRTIIGQTIETVRLFSPKIDQDNHPGWLKRLRGKTFLEIHRRGKNILINLDDGYTLWIHLKMTGHLYYLPKIPAADKHDLMIFNLKNNHHQLRFNDYRRFGRVRLIETDRIDDQPGLADLGPEPLKISSKDFVERFRSSSRMIKPALLDQCFLAGLGNIYTDESLFAARLHPRRSTGGISRHKLAELHAAIQEILRKAIRLMGTSVDSFAGVFGRPGGYQKYLVVYGREKEPCRRCGATIRREKIGSRSAHFCPRCQRPPRR